MASRSIVGSMSTLKGPTTGLGMSSSDIRLAGAPSYVAGACLGALFFQAADRPVWSQEVVP